jgi:hypothetical protein
VGPFNQSYCKTIGLAGINSKIMFFSESTIGRVATLTGEQAQANPAWRAFQLVLALDVYPKLPDASENVWKAFDSAAIEAEVNKCAQTFQTAQTMQNWDLKVTEDGVFNAVDLATRQTFGQMTYIRTVVAQTRPISYKMSDRRVYLKTYGFNCRQLGSYVSSTYMILDREGDFRAVSDLSDQPSRAIVQASSLPSAFQTAACAAPTTETPNPGFTLGSLFDFLNTRFPEFAPVRRQ